MLTAYSRSSAPVSTVEVAGWHGFENEGQNLVHENRHMEPLTRETLTEWVRQHPGATIVVTGGNMPDIKALKQLQQIAVETGLTATTPPPPDTIKNAYERVQQQPGLLKALAKILQNPSTAEQSVLPLFNLKGIDLQGLDWRVLLKAGIPNLSFASLDLRGEDLSNMYLRNADLSNANLAGKNLEGANLEDVDLSGANLEGANLLMAYCRNSGLMNANLRKANLNYANLRSADLWGVNLESANLRSADLHEAILTKANLIGANLSGAKLEDAYLTGAYLTGAYLPFAFPFRIASDSGQCAAASACISSESALAKASFCGLHLCFSAYS